MAGFNQASPQSLVPDSVGVGTDGATFDTFLSVSLEQKFDTGTYLALSGEILYSQSDHVMGGFVDNFDQVFTNGFPTYTTGFGQTVDYRERNLVFTADQLLGKQWSVGQSTACLRPSPSLSYDNVILPRSRFTQSVQARQSLESVLETVSLHANWNHPSGLFSVLEANWYHQDNSGFLPAEPGDDFWQFNAFAGCRFWHRRAEVTVGLLNIANQNYQLEPLNLYNEMARGRTFTARLLVTF